jgi:hypothetical protein
LIAVELKLESFQPAHVGQMELYLRWLDKYERAPGEDAPIGLILCASAEFEQVELLELDAKSIRVSEYLTELPPLPLLRARLHQAIEHARENAAKRPEGPGERARATTTPHSKRSARSPQVFESSSSRLRANTSRLLEFKQSGLPYSGRRRSMGTSSWRSRFLPGKPETIGNSNEPSARIFALHSEYSIVVSESLLVSSILGMGVDPDLDLVSMHKGFNFEPVSISMIAGEYLGPFRGPTMRPATFTVDDRLDLPRVIVTSVGCTALETRRG